MPGEPESALNPGAEPSGPAPTAARPRVDFYVIEDSSSTGRLKLACRLAEKAYLADQSVLVWHSEPEELKAFDDLLWTFADRSFVPHEWVQSAVLAGEAPVLLSSGIIPERPLDVVINLAADIPACMGRAPRIVEIIDGDDARRRAGRVRFKAYRDLGLQPATHNIRAE